jgi:hypothetical protein
MATPTPYRILPAERRVALVTHAIKSGPAVRALYVQRLMAKRGGFRAVTLQSWPVDRLAKEIVQMRAETPQDELELLHLLYVELEPAIQITFLDAAGVKHENGIIAEELETPYADEAAVRSAAAAICAAHGAAAEHYLMTLARYSRDAWPGIEGVAAELCGARATGV